MRTVATKWIGADSLASLHPLIKQSSNGKKFFALYLASGISFRKHILDFRVISSRNINRKTYWNEPCFNGD